MKKENKIIALVIGIILLILMAWQFGWFTPKNNEPIAMPEGIVLFSAEGCPYCKIVGDFISENKVTEKIELSKLDVPYNGKTSAELIANANLLQQAAEKCGKDTREGVPIPFLYDGEESCFVGYVEIIDFLKEKAGIVEETEIK
jgi:hypothetical protein